METLHIQHSHSLPTFHFAPEDEQFYIRGSFMGNAGSKLKSRLNLWTRQYINSPLHHTSLHIQLQEMDEAGLECLYDLLKTWEGISQVEDSMIKAIFYFEAGDKQLEVMGNRLGRALDFPFEMVKTAQNSKRILGRYLILKAESKGLEAEDQGEGERELKDLSADDFKIMTAISDRLQKKLNLANEKLKSQSREIQRINRNLGDRNQELEDTINALTKAKAGRKASTYVLIVAVFLFMVSEGIEEIIEFHSEGVLGLHWIILIKLSLALLLKPMENFIEGRILKKMIKPKKAKQVEVSKQ